MKQDQHQNDVGISFTPLFSLGATVATPGALDLLDRTGMNATTYLARHRCGDFGTLSPHDIQGNGFAVKCCLRIYSVYELDSERLWLITEGDRSVTTLLLPSEY